MINIADYKAMYTELVNTIDKLIEGCKNSLLKAEDIYINSTSIDINDAGNK